MRAIFISYRREDAEGQAGRLFTDLVHRFGEQAVFMDVAAIEPGRDFRRAIDEHVASCGVMLTVIGKNWLDARNDVGARRLDDPHDFVRLETASALKRDIPVVPVLVQGASMPQAPQLPTELGDLAFRNAIELTHARWESDVSVLVKALNIYVNPNDSDPEQQTREGVTPPRMSFAPAFADVTPTKAAGDPELHALCTEKTRIVLGGGDAVGLDDRMDTHRELPEVARSYERRGSVGSESARPNEGSTQAQKKGARASAWTISKHELTGIELVLIPAGTFKMGSPRGQGEENEQPQHEVTLSEFELSKYPVTREQYKRFLKANRKVKPPPFWDDRRFNQVRQPVVGVTWDAARAYADWAGLRLPTEAEWEYACRAGSKTRFCSGDTKDELVQVGWFGSNSGGRLHEVGEKPPNGFGLHDLHGNVWEWCSDWYRSSYDPAASIDPAGPERGDDRVLRGGTWYDPAELARSAFRLFHHPASAISSVGFRVARGLRTGR